jgi:uncharacterized protein GlcG (DUF336 family)
LLTLAQASCDGSRLGNPANTAEANQSLTAAEIERIIAAAVSEAEAADVAAAIAIVDREGEVLGVFVTNTRDQNGDGVQDPISKGNIHAAISKAGTAAYFASEQNAFSTRSALFIVQGNFPPGVRNTDAGPLFGVQDSCQVSSDNKPLAVDQAGNAVSQGITGEFGGFPLYKNGAPVGGIGVDTADVFVVQGGQPTLISPQFNPLDERIAVSGSRGFESPTFIRADQAFIDGFAVPFGTPVTGLAAPLAADVAGLKALTLGDLDPDFPVRVSPLPPEDRVNDQFGLRTEQRFIARRVAARGDAALVAADAAPLATFNGVSYRFENIPQVAMAQATLAVPSEIRYPAIASLDPVPASGGLTAAEAESIIAKAVARARPAAAGIRLPRGSGVRVHIAVCDLRGNLLAVTRMGDGTLFSFDVAVQKARTAAFFSTDDVAITPRSIGFLSQPFFPPGIDGTEAGPLVRLRSLINRGLIPVEDPPFLTLQGAAPRFPNDGTFDDDPFTPGLQAANDYGGFVNAALKGHLASIRADTGVFAGLSVLADRPDLGTPFISPGLMNGLQTFPGGVPLYRDGKLIGGLGVSGDGVEEDDLVAFAGGEDFTPRPGIRVDEVDETTIANVLNLKAQALASAMAAHPDPRIAAIYGPIFAAERVAIADRLSRGLDGVRIPYVKLPRNPDER